MAVKVKKVANWLESLAPSKWALDWDNVGLQVGNSNDEIKGIFITLTPTVDSLDRAVINDCNLVISHHPLIFKGLKSISATHPVYKSINLGLSVISLHTNLDVAPGGVSDALLKAIGLLPLGKVDEDSFGIHKPISPTSKVHSYKLVTYVPVSHLEKVRQALFESGAGKSLHYKECAFWTKGRGSFVPLEDSQPFVGSIGEVEEVDEYRLETLVFEDNLQRCIDGIKASHPYEEAAYDVIPLNEPRLSIGLGRSITLTEALTLGDLAYMVKSNLRMGDEHVRVSGDIDGQVRRVGVCGGSGGDLILQAAKKVDVLVTGDIKYHDALLAQELGLSLIDAGHYTTERPVLEILADFLQARLETHMNIVPVIVDTGSTTPFTDV